MFVVFPLVCFYHFEFLHILYLWFAFFASQPIFKDLEAQFKERTQEFETTKKSIVGKQEKQQQFELVRTVFTWVSKSHWLCTYWSIFHPIRIKSKTNLDWFARVSSRFASATCNFFEFWLVHCIFCVLCDSRERLRWLWFYDTRMLYAV